MKVYLSVISMVNGAEIGHPIQLQVSLQSFHCIRVQIGRASCRERV